ncbi:peptide ABC transporter substrate-binding protein [Sciscionella marina]|uniref:peptide ABC transporter substrate-binding protein n=1 Tax=Sciscionella marina TaxID=508770 RepID=UPI0003A28BE4|nr:ABC transporter substrate-binding protein [Sciscionella marina]
MRVSRKGVLPALPLAAALVLAGCGGGAGKAEDGTVTLYGNDPQNPLIPSNTQESEGGKIVDAMWSGLLKYNPDTGKAENEMATSITPSEKNTVFDVKFKKGWKFQDGTEVKADNFIDAWNYAAYAPHAQNDAAFFSDIKGYKDVHPADEKAKPATDKMSGLQKVNDYEFRVTLSASNVTFKQKLGYNAFYPMPAQFFAAKDKDQWAKKPVGNGPFEFADYQPSVQTTLRRWDGYAGKDKPAVDKVEFKVYQSQDAAYRDLESGNLDFMEMVPPSALVEDKYQKDLDGRTLGGTVMSDQFLAIPQYRDPAWRNPDLVHGISMAIDRAQITKQIFNNARKPMDGFVPDSVPGSAPNACGQYCEYHPQQAKALVQRSGYRGTIPIQSNADGGHKEWIEAVVNSVNKALQGTGVSLRFDPVPTFQVLRQQQQSHQLTGMTRGTWNYDFPSPDSELAAQYETGGSSNFIDYSNPGFDAKLKQARAASTEQEAAADFGAAERLLTASMPHIPLWSEQGIAGYSDKIKSVKLNKLKRVADLSSIRLAK